MSRPCGVSRRCAFHTPLHDSIPYSFRWSDSHMEHITRAPPSVVSLPHRLVEACSAAQIQRASQKKLQALEKAVNKKLDAAKSKPALALGGLLKEQFPGIF
jgi:hypothetical protein